MTVAPAPVHGATELARRVEALPAELKARRTRSQTELDMHAHFSQLEALAILVDALVKEQRELLEALDPAGDPDAFVEGGYQLIGEIIKSPQILGPLPRQARAALLPRFQARPVGRTPSRGTGIAR